MSDGQAYEGTKKSLDLFKKGRKEKDGLKTYCEELPKDIRTIDVYFMAHEWRIHSIVFHGETTLNVGPSKEPEGEENDGFKKGRKETFYVDEGQELLGWE